MLPDKVLSQLQQSVVVPSIDATTPSAETNTNTETETETPTRLKPALKGQAQVHFEQEGSQLTAVEIGRDSRFPVVSALHRSLFALGIIVASYQVRTRPTGLVERIVLQRRDGGAIEGSLSTAIKEAILPIALDSSMTPA